MLIEFLWTWGPWAYNRYIHILNTTSKIYQSVNKDLYGTDNWIFIRDSNIPISEELFDTNSIEYSDIKWKATIDPPVFRDPSNTEDPMKLKHLSYLGFSVTIPGDKTFDLSDWINEIRWNGTTQPLPSDIFSLWCCKNRLPLLYYTKNVRVEIITETGDTIKKGLNDFTHTNIYENANDTQTNGPDSKWLMDVVLSSSGR